MKTSCACTRLDTFANPKNGTLTYEEIARMEVPYS